MKAIAVLSLTLLSVPAVQAFNPQPEPPGFGMIGVVSSQTAPINVSWASPPEPDRAFPSGPCAGALQLRFVDQAGRVLSEQTVRLGLGESTALEYSSSGRIGSGDATGGAGLRSQIRATVSWSEFPPGPCRTGALFGNVEVYDTDGGQTQFVLPGTLGAFQEAGK